MNRNVSMRLTLLQNNVVLYSAESLLTECSIRQESSGNSKGKIQTAAYLGLQYNKTISFLLASKINSNLRLLAVCDVSNCTSQCLEHSGTKSISDTQIQDFNTIAVVNLDASSLINNQNVVPSIKITVRIYFHCMRPSNSKKWCTLKSSRSQINIIQ